MLRVASCALLVVLLTVVGCPAASFFNPDANVAEGEGEGEISGEPPADPCAPVADGTASIVEGDALDVVIRCSTGKVVTFEVPSIPALPAGLALAADNHLRWQTDLDDATVVDVEVRDPDTREKVIVHVAVADAFGIEGNVAVVDPLAYTEEFGLPVVFLSAQPQREEYVAAQLVAAGHRYRIETKLRGASSLGYPKRSFTLKFEQTDRFYLPAREGQRTADSFADKKKVVLTSTFDDNAYVRQRLSYQVWNRTGAAAGREHITIQSTSVVVYIDGDYFGLYTMTDHVDRDLFEESLGLEDGGQLYKSINHDANFRNTDNPSAGYERRDEPDVDVIEPFSDMNALVMFANTSNDDDFASGLDAHIAVDDVINWWVFATAITGEDSYGKNAYFYRPSVAINADGVERTPVFRFAPWDFNQSFGQSWEASRTGSDIAADEGWPMDTNKLWDRLAHGVRSAEVRAIYGEVIRGNLDEAVVLGLFEAMQAETELAARKDASVWADDYDGYFGGRGGDDYDSEVQLIRDWIPARWSYLREHFPTN